MATLRALTEPRPLFEAMVDNSMDSLAIFVRSLIRDPGAVDDVVQESLIVAWRNFERFDHARPFDRWLRGIARKLILAHFRKRAHQPLLDSAVIDRIEGFCSATQALHDGQPDQRLAVLRECIDGLPSTYRQTIRLRYQEDIRGPRLAERLQATWTTTRKRLERGKRLVFECMQRKWAWGSSDLPSRESDRDGRLESDLR